MYKVTFNNGEEVETLIFDTIEEATWAQDGLCEDGIASSLYC